MADRRRCAGLGEIGEEAENRVVECDAPFLHKLQYDGGRELLGDGAEAEEGLRRYRFARLQISQAAAPGIDRLPAAGDNDGTAWSIRRVGGFDDGISLGGKVYRLRRDRFNARCGRNHGDDPDYMIPIHINSPEAAFIRPVLLRRSDVH